MCTYSINRVRGSRKLLVTIPYYLRLYLRRAMMIIAIAFAKAIISAVIPAMRDLRLLRRKKITSFLHRVGPGSVSTLPGLLYTSKFA